MNAVAERAEARGRWPEVRVWGFISFGLYLIHVLVFGLHDNYVSHLSNRPLRPFLEAPSFRFALAGGICIFDRMALKELL